jgi:hypothetical protein
LARKRCQCRYPDLGITNTLYGVVIQPTIEYDNVITLAAIDRINPAGESIKNIVNNKIRPTIQQLIV